eukprot:3677631-Pleurochrysis_carterae.AAC.2
MQRTGAATTVAHQMSVMCENGSLLIQQGQLRPKHTATQWKQRQRALWITISPCASGYQLKNAKEPRKDA